MNVNVKMNVFTNEFMNVFTSFNLIKDIRVYRSSTFVLFLNMAPCPPLLWVLMARKSPAHSGAIKKSQEDGFLGFEESPGMADKLEQGGTSAIKTIPKIIGSFPWNAV